MIMTTKARIFIVEDEPLIGLLLQGTVSDLGCDCVGPVSSLEAALAMARTAEFDAAIMNLVIHGKPAYELCQVLADRNIPFAFASGIPRDSIEPLWRERLFIAKPFSDAEIAQVLAKLLATPEIAIASASEELPQADITPPGPVEPIR
jgi:CheY-like chemotaxis protein